jgi:ABC-type glycerol-3-phosphate transport system permease component
MNRTLIYGLLVAALATMLFPLWYLLVGALSNNPLAPPGAGDLWPAHPRWSNFSEVWQVAHFPRAVLNSIGIAVVITAGNLLFALMTGYALARGRGRWPKVWMATILGVMMMPAHVLIIPLFIELNAFGWIDTYAALTIPFLVSPIAVFIMRQYISSLPGELEDAARVDGASEWYILFKIVAPLCKPAMAVVAIQVFLLNWNTFLFPFIFTTRPEMRTLPVALAFFQGFQQVHWPHLLAASTLATIPILVVFLLFQRQIISGLTAGAFKE